MAESILSAPHFQNEHAAFDYVEAHLWPRGPVCPFCGERERIGRLQGKTTRPGLRKCYACKKPFTVRIGSIFEGSHFPMHLWLQVIHMMCASKKGISSRQIQRMYECSMKTAWFLTHRIRLAMGETHEDSGPLGGDGKYVEADETFIGLKPGRKKGRGYGHKNVVLSLVERGSEVRSFHIDGASVAKIKPILDRHMDKRSILNTDEATHYVTAGREFSDHHVVKHALDEYVRGTASTNTVEGFFSIFKRGMFGVYQHCDSRHLHRYLAEFDFRYNARQSLGVNDQQRASRAVIGAKGKRLTYETTRGTRAGDAAPETGTPDPS
jgi:transposase-like protein